MKSVGLYFVCSFCLVLSTRADITLVEKVEGAGQNTTMTVKIKGNKARVDATPQVTTIIDTSTGEMMNLMNDQKAVVHISAEKMKAAMETMRKYNGKDEPAAKPKLTPTGKKENINGYDAEEYTVETPAFEARYWIAPKYPDAPAILKQLQVLNSERLQPGNMKTPDYADFPGVPVKTVITVGGNEITTTLTSIKQDSLNDSEFVAPKDYHEIQVPEMSTAPNAPEAGKSPAPQAPPKP